MFLKKSYEFLIYSNLLIAFAAVCFTIQTQVQLGMYPQWHPYLFLIFFATLFEYNLHRLITVLFNKNALNEAKYSWVKQHLNLFYLIVVVSVTGFFIASALAKKEILQTLLPLGALTMLYSFPLYKAGRKLFRLREIPILKIFIVSFVWAVTTVALPVIESERAYEKTHIIWLIIERFLFVFAITVPFDVRDMASDQQTGLKTLPLVMGEKKSLMLATIFLVIFIGICLFQYQGSNSYPILAGLILSGVTTIFFVNSKKIKKLPHYHYGILDGTMIIQAVLVVMLFVVFSAF